MNSVEANAMQHTLAPAQAKPFRGIHIYMPAPDYMEECKRLFDVLSFLNYNTVILEVGGTMELKKHPEVNRAWTEFCRTIVEKFPGGPQNFQWSDRYWKDSTHYENARGQIVSQDAVRDLVQHAKSVGINVIPEIQALSHCYYLTLAHREIAEDQNDLFPDTYCPLNEESYKLYFEVAEEILEVIQPEVVSIGHDEIRVLGECPKCREKEGSELLAYEVNRLHAFYKEKNIRIMMWCETLLQPLPEYGITRGAEATDRVDDYGRHYHLPTMYKALDEIPKDVIMLDWYHSMSHNTERCFVDRGFDVVFGNYSGIVFGNWDKRSPHVQGAEISTWCTPDEFTLGRNGVMFDLIYSSLLFANDGFDDSKYREYLDRAMELVEPVRQVMRGEKGLAAARAELAAVCEKEAESGQVQQSIGAKDAAKSVEIIYAPAQGAYHVAAEKAQCYGSNAKQLLTKCGDLNGVPVDTTHVLLDTDIYAESLLLCEAFKKPEDFYMSYSFINTRYWDQSPMSDSNYFCTDMPRWSAATHEILYEDGTWELVNAVYGITGAAVDMHYDRACRYMDEQTAEIDDAIEENAKRRMAPHYKLSDNWQTSVWYFSDTIVSGDSTAYVYEWKNPHPEKKIVRVKCVSTTHDKEQSAILFALGYVPKK